MKKILLIIFTIILILSVNVLAVVIDIGMPAINRANSFIGPRTAINKGNPANETGTITSVEIWATTDLTDCEVATFFVVSGNNLSTRDHEAIGTVTAGSKQTFPVDLDVQAGDYLGIYYSGGEIERDAGGDSVWIDSADRIPCVDYTFTLPPEGIISLYGTGATVGWDHKWNTQTISKWNTKEFTKWNGLE